MVKYDRRSKHGGVKRMSVHLDRATRAVRRREWRHVAGWLARAFGHRGLNALKACMCAIGEPARRDLFLSWGHGALVGQRHSAQYA